MQAEALWLFFGCGGALKQCGLTGLTRLFSGLPALCLGHGAAHTSEACLPVASCAEAVQHRASSRLSVVRARVQADRFHQTGRQLRSKMWWQNMKLKVRPPLVLVAA